MELRGARKVLEEYLSAQWTYTPIHWQNVEALNLGSPLQPVLPQGTTDYIRVDIDLVGSEAITVPGTCRRRYGQLVFSVFVKENKGAGLADDYIDKLIGLFEYKTLGTSGDRLRVHNVTGHVNYYVDSGWFVSQSRMAFDFNKFVSLP
jgi:hypothetical protein